MVDRADGDGCRAAGEGRVGDGAGEGHPAEFGAPVHESWRGLVAGQQTLVQIDRREVAEAGDDDVEEFACGGLQVEGVAYAGARLVQKGEISPCRGRFPGGGATGGDVGSEPGDPDGAPASAVHPVEVDGPVAALVGTGHLPGDVHVRDGVAGLQDPAQDRRHPLGLRAREVVVDPLAAVVVDAAAEDGGEPLVGAPDPEVGVDQQESERRLTENRLRGGEIRLDVPQGAYVHDDAQGGTLAVLGRGRHHIDLGEALGALAVRGGVLGGGHPEGHQAGPLAAVQDLRHLALTGLTPVRGHERLDGVHADGLLGGDAEDLLGPQTPLVDQPVGADGEGRGLDVVVDRTGWTALPHRVPRRHLADRAVGRAGHRAAHSFARAVRGVTGNRARRIARRISPRAVRRVLGLRGLRWYLAHANRPLQLTASGTGHRGGCPQYPALRRRTTRCSRSQHGPDGFWTGRDILPVF